MAVSVPPQVLVRWGPVATNIWPGDEGKKSVNATGIGMLFGLVTVMVRSETAPATMAPGVKDLTMPIWLISLTIKVSLAGGAVPLSVTKAPVVFKWSPGTDEITVAVTVQEPVAGSSLRQGHRVRVVRDRSHRSRWWRC